MFSFKSFTVAIVVPDPEVFEKYTKEKNITGNMAELCKTKVRTNEMHLTNKNLLIAIRRTI